MNSIKAYWRQWLWRDALTRIITINTIVWLVIGALLLLTHQRWETQNVIVSIFGVPSAPSMFVTHCWTAVTYMFAQYDFMHLLINMLWLMLFGKLLMQIIGPERFVAIYLIGGIWGAVAFVLCNVIVPGSHTIMLGASCAVIAVSGAVIVLAPHWQVNLLLFGTVKMLWVGIVGILLFVLTASSLDVAIAHAGGLAYGLMYGYFRKKGQDLTQPFIEAYDALAQRFRRVPVAKPNYHGAGATAAEEAEFDALLAKVSRSGYASLTPQERQRLFTLSQKIKK